MPNFRIHTQTAAIAAAVSLAIGGIGGAAAATHVINGKDIKNGTISRAKLATTARPQTSAQLRDAVVDTVTDPTVQQALGLNITVHGEKGDKGDVGVGATGATGSAGAQGTQGAQGAQGVAGTDGADGANGTDGTDGRNGLDGANAATQVMRAGDAGWTLPGNPAAVIVGGELRLAGGTDQTTPAGGAIGAVKDMSNSPLALGSITALRFDFHVDSRSGSTAVPTVHLALTDIDRTDSTSHNTILAFVAPQAALGVAMTENALVGRWTSSNPITGGADANTAQSLADILASNPQARVTRLSIDNGGTGESVDGFAAGVDNVTLGTGPNLSRYDFGA